MHCAGHSVPPGSEFCQAGPGLVLSNIKIEIGVEFCVGRQQKYGVVKLAPADIGGGILRAAIVVVGPGKFGGAVGAGKPDGFSAVVVFRVVPPVHQLEWVSITSAPALVTNWPRSTSNPFHFAGFNTTYACSTLRRKLGAVLGSPA